MKVINVGSDSNLPDNPSEKIGRETPYIIIKTGGSGMFLGYEATPTYGIQLNLNYYTSLRYRIKSNSSAFGDWIALK